MASVTFKGKSIVRNYHHTVPFHELIPQPDKSVTDEVRLEDNLIIHGDNLAALKALLPVYGGRVKCIYIDPPYNTGTEHWVYNDNVNSPMIKEWLGKIVSSDDMTRHDKWLCMMWPRLQLLRELLRDDGAIFISCDDHEQHRLRMLLDDIFGEENFLSTVIWQKVYSSRMDADQFSADHDYILVYRKNASFSINKEKFEQDIRAFTFVDENGDRYRRRSLRKEGKNSRREDRPNLFYAISAPDGTEVFPIRSDGSEGCWRWEKAKYERDKDKVDWVQDGDGNWQAYVRQTYNKAATKPPSTFWPHTKVGHNHEAVEEIRDIFGSPVFDSPKPTRLISHILELSTDPTESCIVLDSFAGSGSTGHAVLRFNEENETNHRFILIETEDYAESITAERVRRVIQGIPTAKDEALQRGFEGTFSFFELGQAIDENGLLTGETLPPYNELARYVFYTATGETFKPERVDEAHAYIGESRGYEVYLIYQPDIEYLKKAALTLDFATGLPEYSGKKRLVFAPACYLRDDALSQHHLEYAKIPFDIFLERR